MPQLAQQFVACFHYVNRHHNLETLGPNDKIRDVKQEQDQREGKALTSPSRLFGFLFFFFLFIDTARITPVSSRPPKLIYPSPSGAR